MDCSTAGGLASVGQDFSGKHSSSSDDDVPLSKLLKKPHDEKNQTCENRSSPASGSETKDKSASDDSSDDEPLIKKKKTIPEQVKKAEKKDNKSNKSNGTDNRTAGDSSDNEPLIKFAKGSSRAAKKPVSVSPKKPAKKKDSSSDDGSSDDEPLSELVKKLEKRKPVLQLRRTTPETKSKRSAARKKVKYAESSSDSSDDESLAEVKRKLKKTPEEQKSPTNNKKTKTKLKDEPPKDSSSDDDDDDDDVPLANLVAKRKKPMKKNTKKTSVSQRGASRKRGGASDQNSDDEPLISLVRKKSSDKPKKRSTTPKKSREMIDSGSSGNSSDDEPLIKRARHPQVTKILRIILERCDGEEGGATRSPNKNGTDVNGPVNPEDDGSVSVNGGEDRQQKDEEEEESNKPEAAVKRSSFLQRLVRVFFGCLAAVACGILYAAYLSTYHDRKYWFSTRQELEREISFQEGSGLYYYYYKQLLTVPSFERGLFELTLDNNTVSGQTVNAVELLSLYPELITSFLYRVTESQDDVEPVYFYVGMVFGLQAVYVTALFVCSWVMSGTWVAGMLAVAWYVINRPDTTKVDQAIPLRDNWALPYFSCQVAALTGFLSNNISSAAEMFCYLTMSATTFTFLLVWEHSHYVLFIQGLCLLLLDSFDLVPTRKMADIHKVYLSTLFLVYVFQFQNPTLLSSPLLSLLIGSVLARFFQQKMKVGPLVARVLKLFLHFHLVFTTGITFSYVVKKLLPVSESDFILKFLEVKFGLNTTTDFIPNFLMCQESLQTPGQDLFLRLTQASVLPFYVLVLSVCLLSTLQTIYRRLSGQPMPTSLKLEDGRIGEQPEVVYHVFHSLLFGGLTLLFDGMKYLWTPYVCMFTAFGVCSPELWMTVFKWLKLKSVHPVILSLILSTAVPTIIGFSLWREYCPRVLAELSDLPEFYDSDTVELISWIRSQAPLAAVFAGSPQLLGTVKLCSGSAVTSLPLYSDIKLLKRTEDTYQVYGMRSAEDIYKILTAQKTNYVIIEESICNELSLTKGCRVKDLLDISNGHVVYDKGEMYSFSKHGRFCQEIKMNYSPYTNYFTRVFWNRSYHIYKVNSVISFQY